MERFSKTMTGTVLALGLVLGAATSASAFNPQPEPPATPGEKRGHVEPNPYIPRGYLKPGKPAEFHRARKVPQVRAGLVKPQNPTRRRIF